LATILGLLTKARRVTGVAALKINELSADGRRSICKTELQQLQLAALPVPLNDLTLDN
jgi:hypothetical protein